MNPAGIRALLGAKHRPYHKDTLPESDGAEPAADPATIAAPADLTKAERAYWDWFAPLLAGAKVLTPADVETLADYCRACAAVVETGRRRQAAWRKRTLDQSLVRMLDASLRGWIERKTKIAGELGLTAIARTRVAWYGHAQILDKAKKPQSKLAELQEQAAAMRRPMAVK